MSRVKVAEKKLKGAKRKETDPDEGLALRDEIKEQLRTPAKYWLTAEGAKKKYGIK